MLTFDAIFMYFVVCAASWHNKHNNNNTRFRQWLNCIEEQVSISSYPVREWEPIVGVWSYAAIM